MPSSAAPPPPPPKGPQLFLHKPSKAQVKKANVKGSSPLPSPSLNPASRPPSSMDSSSSSSSSSSGVSSSFLNPKKTFLRRIFPLLLVVNFAVGAYIFTRTNRKKSVEKDEVVPDEVPSSASVESSKAIVTAPSPVQPITVPKKVLPPIPEDEQHELLKWILEEKRKIKPASFSEKKKIEEEKALLKQHIRAKSIPSL